MLIAVFTLLPYLRINGKPAILLNIPAREFTLFGFTFLPTDTLLLALFAVESGCRRSSWSRPCSDASGAVGCVRKPSTWSSSIGRWNDSSTGRPDGVTQRVTKRTRCGPAAKYATYLVISMFLAHTFLAYFVGVDNLAQWVRRSPIEHPTSFVVMALTTGAMMFDFSFFREQTCIVACPYGRFQSVMLDRDSLIVSYDPTRGEPRGKGRREKTDGTTLGDCIDCGNCVDTCPTGIDIRDGLQLECVACTQCIDACDTVMDRLGKPRGLIRFSSQSRIAGESTALLRPRVVIYPAILTLLLVAFTFVLVGKESSDITLLRGFGLPYTEINPGEITNQVRVKIKNRSKEDSQYDIQLAGDSSAKMMATKNPIPVAAGDSQTEVVLITAPRNEFREGKYEVTLRISDGQQFSKELAWRLLGPRD